MSNFLKTMSSIILSIIILWAIIALSPSLLSLLMFLFYFCKTWIIINPVIGTSRRKHERQRLERRQRRKKRSRQRRKKLRQRTVKFLPSQI